MLRAGVGFSRLATTSSAGRSFLAAIPRAGRPANAAALALSSQSQRVVALSTTAKRPLVRKDSEIMLARSESFEAELADSQSALSLMLVDQHARAIDEVVPWFLANMPRAYFRRAPRAAGRAPQGVCRFQVVWRDSETTLKSPDGTVTFMREGSYPGMLQEMISQIELMHSIAPLLCQRV